MGKVNPLMRVKVNKHMCAVDKKERYFTNVSRASEINDEILINYATEDSGMRIEQISSVYRSLITQVRELVCNGHSVELGDMGSLYFTVHAKVSAELEGAGAAALTSKRIAFRASKKMLQRLDKVNFSV